MLTSSIFIFILIINIDIIYSAVSTCTDSNCKTCTISSSKFKHINKYYKLLVCTACNNGYFVSNKACVKSCYSYSDIGCYKCTFSTICGQCFNGYYLDSTDSICKNCMSPGCSKCSDAISNLILII